MLHTRIKLQDVQVSPKEKAPDCGAFSEPSDGLEPSTPSLPWEGSIGHLADPGVSSVLPATRGVTRARAGHDRRSTRASVRAASRFLGAPSARPSPPAATGFGGARYQPRAVSRSTRGVLAPVLRGEGIRRNSRCPSSLESSHPQSGLLAPATCLSARCLIVMRPNWQRKPKTTQQARDI